MANYFPLIASVTGTTGLFSELPLGGNIDMLGAGIVNLATANLQLTGGSNGQFLKTDGVGNLAWATVSTSSIANGNSNVSITANGNITMSVGGVANVVKVSNTAAIIENLTVSNSAQVLGNLNTNIINIAVGNLRMTGGTDGQMLKTDGSGALSWATVDTDRISNGASNVIVTSGLATVNANLSVTGNLTVQGTMTAVNSTTVNINDINITLANNATTAAQANGGGFTINGAGANLIYLSGSNSFQMSHQLIANLTGSANTVRNNAQPNITSLGTLSGLTVNGITSLGDVSNVSITGGTSGQVLKTNGAGGLSWGLNGTVTDVTFPSTTGITFSNKQVTNGVVSYSVTNDGVRSVIAGTGISVSSANGNPTITNTGVTSVVAGNGITTTYATGISTVKANVVNIVSGNNTNVTSNVTSGVYTVNADTFVFAKEKVNIINTAPPTTVIIDVINNPIVYYTSESVANVAVNFRGNSTSTLDSILSVGHSITSTFIMINGATSFKPTNYMIDGIAVTPKWASGIVPGFYANTEVSLTFTIIKLSATPTYRVLASVTGYQ
jgi:hypothetical protein